MDEKFMLNEKDVVSLIDSTASPVLASQTFKTIQLVRALRNHLKLPEEWAEQGIPCEILKADVPGWRKGKVRISLEFIPDELEPINEPEDSANAVEDR